MKVQASGLGRKTIPALMGNDIDNIRDFIRAKVHMMMMMMM